MRHNRLLLVVGPAAAGKTTYVDALSRALPGLDVFDDLESLLELTTFEREVQAARAARDVQAFARLAMASAEDMLLANEYVSAQASFAKRHARIPAADVALMNEGFDILNPDVWDWAITWVARRAAGSSVAALQLARGVDAAYLAALGLGEGEVYPRAVALVLQELPTGSSLGIVHVHAQFETRLGRNWHRREAGEHSVADEVMQSVYRFDPFSFDARDHCSGSVGVGARRLPVWSVDNSTDLSEQALRERADQQVSQALHFFEHWPAV